MEKIETGVAERAEPDAADEQGGPSETFDDQLDTDVAVIADDAFEAAPRDGENLFSRKLSVLSDPTGVHSSAVGALQNHLSQQHLRMGRRSLAICSVGNDVGRALVSCNLAIASAKAGASTVLVDGNFREPELDQYFLSTEAHKGLSDYLGGEVEDFSDILQTDVVKNLSIIHAGTRPSDPQTLLAGERLERLMGALMRNFDFTIIDCPPARQSADARRLASIARYALVVGKRDVTFVDDVKQLIDELNSDLVSVIGTFLNVG